MTDQVNEALETLTQYSAEHGHPADFEAAISTLSALAHPARGVVDVRQAAEAWLVSTARKAGPHGVTADQESMMRLGYEAGYRAALQAAQPAVPSVPDGMEGMVLAPHYRGYAKLGSGGYFLYHSGKGELAELVIVPATDSDREGRTVGDLSYDGPDDIPAEHIAVRLRFDNVAGLDALEQQLRLLRDEHFAATPKDQP